MERHLDKETQSIINSIKSDMNIIYFEWIENDEIAQIYAGALYYICVSTLDGESIMLREAMACGTPVITSPLLMPAVKNIAVEVKNPESVDDWRSVLHSAIINKIAMANLKSAIDRKKRCFIFMFILYIY